MILLPHATAAILLLALFSAPPRVEDPPAKAAPAHTIDDVAWISGSWESAGGATTMDENWSYPSGGAMLGTGRVVSGGKMKFFEFLRIQVLKGGLTYVAQPGGGSPTPFPLVKLEKGHAVFENLKHDFPKRIIYKLDGDDTLVTRIEGDGTEKEKAQEFRFKKRKAN